MNFNNQRPIICGLSFGTDCGRYRRLRQKISWISDNDIRRLARRGGVKRINHKIPREIRQILKNFLENVIKDTLVYTQNARRNTVTSLDVIYALKKRGRTLYGFGI